ncbi:MAG: SxtJ family membrane protein [Candidatus Omnitrophota bacterium]|nr:SxtJ family membrane protein [Candidatus Omnitrophota bacterium]
MPEDIKNIKGGRKELREFGLTIGIILVILGGIAVWRARCTGPWFLMCGMILIALGLGAPSTLKTPRKLWMAFAVIIGYFMSRIILVILFYAVVTPISVITKIFGKDILDQRVDKSAVSYWIGRLGQEEKSRESYENQY